MSNGTSHEPPTYAEIYRQIAIILPEGGEFEKQKLEVYKILEGVDYETLSEVPDLRLVAIQVAPGEDLSRILVDLRRARDVVETAEQNRVLRPSWVVDDPLYRHQWALWRIGAESAWQHALATLNLVAPGIIVAIVDSGVHTGHPDLAGHLWTDGAGHHGRNLLTNTFDVSDTDGHGTLLAGTVGAISNNATGIAAAEWPIRLMAVKFLDIRNPPTALSGALAIWWAVTHGAQVITAAWGVGIPSPILQVAIWFANVFNVVFVAAAGNDGLDNDVCRPIRQASAVRPTTCRMSSRSWHRSARITPPSRRSIPVTTRRGSPTTGEPEYISPRRASASSARTRTPARRNGERTAARRQPARTSHMPPPC